MRSSSRIGRAARVSPAGPTQRTDHREQHMSKKKAKWHREIEEELRRFMEHIDMMTKMYVDMMTKMREHDAHSRRIKAGIAQAKANKQKAIQASLTNGQED
jgi:hypothetical protein